MRLCQEALLGVARANGSMSGGRIQRLYGGAPEKQPFRVPCNAGVLRATEFLLLLGG